MRLLLPSLAIALAACGGSSKPTAESSAASASAPVEAAPAPASASASAAPSASSSAAASAPPAVVVGGPCAYADTPGTCTVKPGGTFTFKGTVDGTQVVLENNTISGPDSAPPVGSSVPCSLKFITRGSCTPCGFSMGSCGSAAWDAFRKHATK